MGKFSYLIVGAAVGAAFALAFNYLFGPATGTTYDQNYRSRLDFALEEGQRAATAREAEMRRQLAAYKRPPSQTQRQPDPVTSGRAIVVITL